MYTGGSETPRLSTIARITNTTFKYINGETKSTVWPGWSIHKCLCKDYCVNIIVINFFVESTGIPPIINVISVIKTSVYAYVVTLVTVGLILSTVCLMFNVIFHNRK